MKERPAIPILIEDPPSNEDSIQDDQLRSSQQVARLELSASTLLSSPTTAGSAYYTAGVDGGDIDVDSSCASLSRNSSFAASGNNVHVDSIMPPSSPSKHKTRGFTKHDRKALKQLSTSTPAMPLRTSPARSDSDPMLAPSSSKSRQKKFHRHFKQVSPDEKVLDYYSCALMDDILLQGHLYITEKHFAFYSNVFGYVTKLLIPLNKVIKITKEKTAKIIPNAVGVYSALNCQEQKHVFASLLSRDSTYKLMHRVWLNDLQPKEDNLSTPVDPPSEFPIDKGDSSESGSGNESAVEPSGSTPEDTAAEEMFVDDHTPKSTSYISAAEEVCIKKLNGAIPIASMPGGIVKKSYVRFTSMLPGSSFLLLASTALLVLLFLSASVLIYRINTVQYELERRFQLTDSEYIYQEIAKLQSHLHSTSSSEFQRFLNANAGQIAKVRQTLEALSLLFSSKPDGNQRLQEQHS